MNGVHSGRWLACHTCDEKTRLVRCTSRASHCKAPKPPNKGVQNGMTASIQKNSATALSRAARRTHKKLSRRNHIIKYFQKRDNVRIPCKTRQMFFLRVHNARYRIVVLYNTLKLLCDISGIIRVFYKKSVVTEQFVRKRRIGDHRRPSACKCF